MKKIYKKNDCMCRKLLMQAMICVFSEILSHVKKVGDLDLKSKSKIIVNFEDY